MKNLLRIVVSIVALVTLTFVVGCAEKPAPIEGDVKTSTGETGKPGGAVGADTK